MSEKIIVSLKVGKNKPKQFENVPCFGFETICIISRVLAGYPAIFTKINVPPQVFLCFIIRNSFKLQNTPQLCFFAFSVDFIIRFSVNKLPQDSSGHYSLKSHVWEKVYYLSYEAKSY